MPSCTVTPVVGLSHGYARLFVRICNPLSRYEIWMRLGLLIVTVGVSAVSLALFTFSPDDLGVREKLRLASTRRATREEDVAYSLIGIFESDIRPHYGERSDALGHLLEEIVARKGEVTVLGWSGKSSSYNSCLPASISVYSQIPSTPPSLEGSKMGSCIAELRGKFPREVALSICKQIDGLDRPDFRNRRQRLACIVFRVLGIQVLRRGNEMLYGARVSELGDVRFMTADDLPLNEPWKLVFAHPWIDHIRGPDNVVAWGADLGADTNPNRDSDYDAEPDRVAPPSPLHASPFLKLMAIPEHCK
ncbi:hypothetical protein BKA82DRAFT_28810 [Pisolithus tinctorius]|uniref:Transmembrane protein n=1 Tax=Pisolithus tinctorius Marx 270 TaxID=870435 RepID=A0A0C3P1R4_PISTI|nr:hypothetical protein BKA82DRAFT_28810 [Pisolithus tinctorius]KIO01274.1 hypothetical protein M404DRAFT_28810 [Pisolithus tinctorius Marx 270]